MRDTLSLRSPSPVSYRTLLIDLDDGSTMRIGGVNADISYCGSAPGPITHQVSFTYPPGVPVNGPNVSASITVNGKYWKFYAAKNLRKLTAFCLMFEVNADGHVAAAAGFGDGLLRVPQTGRTELRSSSR